MGEGGELLSIIEVLSANASYDEPQGRVQTTGEIAKSVVLLPKVIERLDDVRSQLLIASGSGVNIEFTPDKIAAQQTNITRSLSLALNAGPRCLVHEILNVLTSSIHEDAVSVLLGRATPSYDFACKTLGCISDLARNSQIEAFAKQAGVTPTKQLNVAKFLAVVIGLVRNVANLCELLGKSAETLTIACDDIGAAVADALAVDGGAGRASMLDSLSCFLESRNAFITLVFEDAAHVAAPNVASLPQSMKTCIVATMLLSSTDDGNAHASARTIAENAVNQLESKTIEFFKVAQEKVCKPCSVLFAKVYNEVKAQMVPAIPGNCLEAVDLLPKGNSDEETLSAMNVIAKAPAMSALTRRVVLALAPIGTSFVGAFKVHADLEFDTLRRSASAAVIEMLHKQQVFKADKTPECKQRSSTFYFSLAQDVMKVLEKIPEWKKSLLLFRHPRFVVRMASSS